MKKKIILAVLIIASFIVQSTICQYISIGNICPNLLIIVVASFGFMGGKKAGITAGFLTGILVDIFYGQALGFNALIFMYIGFFNGFFKRLFFKDDLKLQILLIASSDLVYGVVYYLLLFLLRGRFHMGYYFLHVIIPEMVYTILLTLVLYPLVMLYHRLVERWTKRSNTEIV